MAAARYVFTIFDYSKPFLTVLPGWANYLVVQEEVCPSTQRKHLQGFVILKRSQRISFLKRQWGNSCHFEAARGSSTRCKEYCTKDATRCDGPWEFGMLVEQGSKKRKAMQRFREEPDELRLSDPTAYRRCLAEEINLDFKNNVELPDFNRPWQVCLDRQIQWGPDDRTIIWVFGSKGNEGKTTRAKGYVKDGWFYTRGGKTADVKYSYSMHMGHVIFDLPRQSEDLVQYQLIEELKDRMIRSTKYEPVELNSVKRIHVVVFANFMPQLETEYDAVGRVCKRPLLSRDRVIIVSIDDCNVTHNGIIIEEF